MGESIFTNQKYLKENQYHKSDNLNARIKLHELFTVTDTPWFAWVYDHLALQSNQHILELGSGTGRLWLENLSKLPNDCKINLSDLSAGMLVEIQGKIKDQRFSLMCMDAQNINFPNNHFDLIIANHMLYHVPDLSAALIEICKVLKPTGKLVAATNGIHHMEALYDLLHEFNPNIVSRKPLLNFNLENGEMLLSPFFSNVKRYDFASALHVTEIQPLLDYYSSMQTMGVDFNQYDQVKFSVFLEDKLQNDGKIIIKKAQGLFVAS
ncbi:MAG: methyltransferase domain-containing protein [Anaerolineaceae bacterium]|nr:methyltransferase domain-containing protein [Anaerolineaceae bacterium]